MKTCNIATGLILCILVINITVTLVTLTVFGVCAAPAKQFDAQQKKLTLTDASGVELQIKQISIKEGVCKFEEVFEVTALNNDYTPSRSKDFKLKFKNKKQEDVKHKINTEEWFVWEDNEWKPVKWKKIKKGETKRYKLILTKQAELGDKRILTVPSFMGIEDERLSWWNVSWQYRINSTLDDVVSGGYVYNLTVHGGSGTNNQTDVFLYGHNATNFSDIRFVLDDTTELDYWIENNTTDPVKVFVDIPDNGTVYLYYGNPDVNTTSDREGVFPTQHYTETKSGCSYDAGGYVDIVFTIPGVGENPIYIISPNLTTWVEGYLYGDSNYDVAQYHNGVYYGQAHPTSGCDGVWHVLFENVSIISHINTTLTVRGDADPIVHDYCDAACGCYGYHSLAFKGTAEMKLYDKTSINEWQTWSTAETEEVHTEESITQYNSQRKLVRTSEGYLHRVYSKFDGSNYRVYYAKSTDDGSTWTKTVLTSGTDCKNPTIASDSEDNLWVVYEKYHYGIMYRKNSGLSWDNEQEISGDYGLVPTIAVDSNDNIHVAWYTDYVIYWVRYRTYNGTAWSSTQNVRESNYPKYPSIAVDTNNYVHVVWQEKNATTNTYNIKHRKKTSSWQPVYNITSGETYNQTHPCIATDLSGNAHIIWQTQDHQIKYIKYKSDGSWETIKTVCDGDIYEQRNPSISVYSDYYVYTTWFGQSASHHDNYIIRESHKTTGSWSSASDILYPTGKDVVYPSLVSALYPKICSDCYTNVPSVGYTFVYDEDNTIKYHESDDLAWRCPTKYTLTIKAINTKTGADVTSFSADIGTGETKTTTNGIVTFRCLDTGYYSLKVTATGYYTYIDNIVIDATKEITVPLTAITEPDYFLPKTKTVTFTVQNLWGTTKFEDVRVEAVGYNITHPEGWLGDIFGFTNETEIYNTTQNGTTDSEGQISFVMVETIKYKITFVKEDAGINKTWFKYPTRDEYTIVIWAWEYPEEGTEGLLETALDITTSTINDTHALIHVNYTDPSNLTSSVNINITRLTTFNREETVWNYTVTNQSIVNESFVVTPYQGRSFTVKVTALHEKWGEKIWEYGIKFKGLLSDLELPEKMYPIIAIALIFFIGGFFGATTALQGSLVVSIVGWIFYGIGWLSLAPDAVMISALSLATVMSVLGLLMERGRKAGVQ